MLRLIVCRVPLLAILLLVHVQEVISVVDLADFFPYGAAANDNRLHPNDDQYSPQQNISIEFTFFTERHSSLYVNTNGVISFKSGTRQFNSDAFPQIGRLTILSPFWADIDTRYCDDDCSIWYRQSVEPRDLDKATGEVLKYFPIMKHFKATWTYIATWYNVARFGDQDSDKLNNRNTFQAVMISDGESSFVLYYYNRIEWTGTGTPAQVGFNMGDYVHYYSVEGSRTDDIINLPNLSNVNNPGVFAFRVDLKEIHIAPPPGEPGKCYLKAADLVIVLDLSLSINTTKAKSLIKDLIDLLPINEYEFQVALTTFSDTAEGRLYFDNNKTKDGIKDFIEEIDVVSSTSNLKPALSTTRQMYMYSYRGSRAYANKYALIFTDGLMPEGSLVSESNNLKSLVTVAMVGIGKSVRHALLDKLATNKTVLSPNAENIWKFLQINLARPSCLVCSSEVNGNIHILLDDSSQVTTSQFLDGKQFVINFLLSLAEVAQSNVTVSIDIIGQNRKSVLPPQDLNDLNQRAGVLSMTDYRGGAMNVTDILTDVQDLVLQNTSNNFIIIVSNGNSLNGLSLDNIIPNELGVTITTVGLGQESNWDNLESLASSGYFVFDQIDAVLAANHIGNKLYSVTCK